MTQSRSRSQSPRRREDYQRNALERGRNHDRAHRRSRSRSLSPPRKRRYRSGSDSRSRSRSASRRRDKSRGRRDRDRERERELDYKRQTRSRSRSRTKRRDKQREHRSPSRSRPASLSSSSSSDSARHRKKRRKDKHRKRSRSRDRKEKKKSKKDKKKKKSTATLQWGKYGIINESNMYDKEEEFRTWLVEERMINPEVLSKEQTKKEFAKFAEDYNTATLPHEKYYNITSYERRMTALRTGETLPPTSSTYDPDADLRAHSSAHKQTRHHQRPNESGGESFMSKEQLQELRKVQAERYQVGKMKLMGMNIGQSFGVRMDGNEFEE